MKYASARNRAAAALAGLSLASASVSDVAATSIPTGPLGVNFVLDLDGDGRFDLEVDYIYYGDTFGGGPFQASLIEFKGGYGITQLVSRQPPDTGFLSRTPFFAFATAEDALAASRLLPEQGRATSGRPGLLRVMTDDPAPGVQFQSIRNTMFNVDLRVADTLNDYGRELFEDGGFIGGVFTGSGGIQYAVALNLTATYAIDDFGKERIIDIAIGQGSVFEPLIVPEPASLSALGVMSLFALRRRRRG